MVWMISWDMGTPASTLCRRRCLCRRSGRRMEVALMGSVAAWAWAA